MLWCHQSPWPLSSLTRVWGPRSMSRCPCFFRNEMIDRIQVPVAQWLLACLAIQERCSFCANLANIPIIFLCPLPGSVLFLQRCRGAVKMFFQGRIWIMILLSNSSVGIVAGLRKREKAADPVWVRWMSRFTM